MNSTVSTLSTRMRRCFKLSIVVSLVSLGLQAAGCGTKGWMIWRMKVTNLRTGKAVGAEIFTGLWEMKYCDASTDICVTVGLDELNTLTSGTWTMHNLAFRAQGCLAQTLLALYKVMRLLASYTIINVTLVLFTFKWTMHMLEFQVEVCLALALLTIFTVILLACYCSDYNYMYDFLKGVAYCMILLPLASGILALVASGRFGDGHRKVHELLLPRSPFLFPYSLILTAVGGILACLQGLLTLPVLKPWQREPESQTQAPAAAAAYAIDRPSQALGSKPASHQDVGRQYPSQQGGDKSSNGQQFDDTRYVHRY